MIKNGKINHNKSRPQGVFSTEKIEDIVDSTAHKVLPSILSSNSRTKAAIKVKLSDPKTKFERKARSNSPKESTSIKINTNLKQRIFKHHSPSTKSAKQEVPKTATHKPISNNTIAHGIPRNDSANKINKSKLSSEGIAAKKNSTKVGNKSPHGIKKNISNKLSQKKIDINEDLWEAAGNGDIEKITKLLSQYAVL